MRLKFYIFIAAVMAFCLPLATRGSNEISVFSIPKRIRQIEYDNVSLDRELQSLPVLEDSLQFEAYGYHSGYLPALDDIPEKPRWTVDLSFFYIAKVQQVILVPAIDRRFIKLRSYAFPKRFRLSYISHEGEVTVFYESMDSDFSDPGRMPVVIDVPYPSSNRIRLEVFKGAEENGKEYFALDEIFSVINDEIGYVFELNASSEFRSLPYWGKEFLGDHRTSMGLPVKKSEVDGVSSENVDFIARFEKKPLRECVIELDLGQNRLVGWLSLFPAQSTGGMMIPGYGFPGKIELELIEELEDGGHSDSRFIYEYWHGGNPGNNVVNIHGKKNNARWLRLHCSDIPAYNGETIFAMGEIIVYQKKEIFPISKITLEGFPDGAEKKVGFLKDGKAKGFSVMLVVDWLRQIDRRNQISHILDSNFSELNLIRTRWQRFWIFGVSSIVGLLSVAALCFAAFTHLQRRRQARSLRNQITRDLHDDIGSRLSAMGLASTYLQRVSDDPLVQERSEKMERMAREMQVALADVLWFTNSETDSLPQLFERLEEIASQSVPPDVLVLKSTPVKQIPELSMGVMPKRDVLLVFKEIINNAVKHSEATNIVVDLKWEKPYLVVRVSDNGKGFDVQQAHKKQRGRPNLGMNSMERRAGRLNGDFKIDSAPGKGCTITVTVKV